MTKQIAGPVALAYLRAWEYVVGREALVQQIALSIGKQKLSDEQKARILEAFKAFEPIQTYDKYPALPTQLLAIPFHGYRLANPHHKSQEIQAQTMLVGKLWWQGSPPIARPVFTGLRSLFEPQINEFILAPHKKYRSEIGAELIELCFAGLLGSQSALGYQCQVLNNGKVYDNQYLVSVKQCPACLGQHQQCAVTQGLISAAWEWLGWDSYKLQMDSQRKIKVLHPHALQLK